MKNFNIHQYPVLSQAGALALHNKKSLLLSAFLFLTGVFTGVFLELTMALDEKTNLASYLQQYLYMDGNQVDYPNPFASSLSNNLFLLLLIFLAGLSALGFPVAFAALLYKGMALGFCTGLILETLKGKGTFLILSSLVPQNLLFIPVFILAVTASTNYGLLALAGRRNPRKKSLKEASSSYIVLTLILGAAIIAGCAIEAILYPIVLSP